MIHEGPAFLLLLLIAAHAVADYPLQGEFLALGKNHRKPLPAVPWQQALAAHALIHGGFVAVLTGSVLLGISEVLVHAATDWLKCEGKIGFNTDQAIHVACKVLWVAILAFGWLP